MKPSTHHDVQRTFFEWSVDDPSSPSRAVKERATRYGWHAETPAGPREHAVTRAA